MSQDFKPLFVIPADVRINYLDEWLNSDSIPVPKIEQFLLSRRLKKLSQTALLGEHPLHDIERISLASRIRESHPGSDKGPARRETTGQSLL